MLAPGDPAPPFTAPVVGGDYSDGSTISLADLRGHTVILYFYPKDDTPGCTTQACAMRDRYSDIIDAGALVFGVSVDPPKSHAKFIAKHALPFPLLSDEARQMVHDYGVWVEKSMYGKKYMGTERSTFVIGPDGKIRSIFRKVTPGQHAGAILDNLNHFEP